MSVEDLEVAAPGRCPVAHVDIDLSQYRYNDPAGCQDPFPVYDQLLQAGVVRSEIYGGYWVASRHEDVFTVYQNPEIFSSFPNIIPAPEGSEDGGLGAVGRLIPLEVDPPEHNGYRHILADPFSPRAVAQYEPWVRERVNAYLDEILRKGECEFLSEFADRLPSEMWCRLMDAPIEDAHAAATWAYNIVHGDADAPDGGLALRQEAGAAVYGYLGQKLAEKRVSPGEDLISYLLAASYEGSRPLSDMEILNTCFFILMASLDTTRGVLGQMIWFLAEHPEHRARLAGEPGITKNAMEELLRWSAPVTPGRRLVVDAELGGVPMKAGDRVLLLTGASGRDPRQFDDPHEVDFDRGANRHLAFGAGIHRCTGSHLARMEIRVVLEEMHRRMPDYHLKPGAPVEWRPNPVRGPERLYIVVGRSD